MDFYIDLDIDTEKFFSVGNDIERLANAIDIGIKQGENEFIARLRDKILENLILYGLADSNIAQNITLTPYTGGVSITCGASSGYAMFVEYGTGLVGKNNPHPKPANGWIYQSGDNSSTHEGWFYPTTIDDPNPYKHTYNGQLYGFTKGMASRPFMYKSWLWGVRSAKNIINKNIRNQIKMVTGGAI